MRVRAYAKINLDLRVLALRPDGYHDISTVFQTVAAHDIVALEVRPGPIEVTCDDPAVPGGDANLCARALRALWARCGRTGLPGGVSIRITKRVPMAAGLGGGSSDAAATLAGLARLWSLADDDPRVFDAAAEIGSDVPFLLVGGTALGQARGEVLTPLRDVPHAEVVLVRPPFGVFTPDAYRWFDELQSSASTGGVAASVSGGRVLSPCQNDLERPVAIRHPEIAELNARLRASGARLAAMTGSGSAVFGLFDTARQADRAAHAMRDGAHLVIRTSTLGRGAFRQGRWLDEPARP
jgi:4-diphosphocytidyl-2-C-methyl-D-erythritol kinase